MTPGGGIVFTVSVSQVDDAFDSISKNLGDKCTDYRVVPDVV